MVYWFIKYQAAEEENRMSIKRGEQVQLIALSYLSLSYRPANGSNPRLINL